MGKMNHLQHLSCFVVGKHEEKGIKELGTLSNLQGSFSITNLENVTNNYKALEARIMDKKHLEELELKWSPYAVNFTDSRCEMDILGKLQSGKNLKKLNITRYRGTRFPKWVGDPSYRNITGLRLYECLNCCILPPLGQLCSLKKLFIGRLHMLEMIGSEFLKDGDSFSGTPFPSLELLWFDDMSCWESWNHPIESGVSFPVLKSLVIRGCPKLLGDLPTHLPALENIEIERCGHLASSLPSASAIKELQIRNSNKVVLGELPSSLEVLRLMGREVIEFMFESIAITMTTSLRTLWIMNCSSAISFPGDCLPESLKELTIINCRKLYFPKQNHQHESLHSLSIQKSCDCLTTLALDTLPNLGCLYIYECENIECLSMSKSLQNLSDIQIRECPNFVSFPREGLFAPNLTSLIVYECPNLKSLACHVNSLLPNLEDLRIQDCPEIESFPEGGMPPSLRSLEIENCEKLLRNLSLTSMHRLTKLNIRGPCDGLESFPEEGFASVLPSLTSLTLYGFSSLHTLECTELLCLTSLQQLTITSCPKLENIVGEKLPASLITLDITDCPLLEEQCRMKLPQI